MSKKIFTLADGTVINRTLEFMYPDPRVTVILPDGYSVVFFEQRLKNVEYARRTMLIRQWETEAK